MIRLNVTTAIATITETETLTAGRRGLECEFTFSSEWSGLYKTAVFEGGVSRDVVMLSNTVTVPWEVLDEAGYNLRVGVYGTNAAGDIVIPTVWAKAGKILLSATPSTVEAAPPTPDLVTQIREMSETALLLASSVKDGYSPTISSSSITGGHRLTITDVNGTDTVDVMDGAAGSDGADGADGVSPTVAVASITGGHAVTITDADHPGGQSFNVMDGEDATIDATLSNAGEAADAKATGDAIAAKYTLPVSGIPKTALASGVQTSLGLADTAYQKPGTGIPSSDLATAVQTSLGLADTAYQKPSGGIPKTDLASAVQTSLGKADTALQTAPVSSVNGQTGSVTLSIPSTAAEVGAIAAPEGGSVGQVLKKTASGTEWANESGGGGTVDIQVANSLDAWQRLTVGQASSGDLIGTTGNRYESSTTRISTKPPISIEGASAMAVTVEEDYKFCIYWFNAELTQRIGTTGWVTESTTYTVPSGTGKIVLSIAKVSDDIILKDDYDKVSFVCAFDLQSAVSILAGDVADLSDEIFIVTYNTTNMQTFTCDRTYSQIVAAINAGKQIVVIGTQNGAVFGQIGSYIYSSDGIITVRIQTDILTTMYIKHNISDVITYAQESITANTVGAVASDQGSANAGKFLVVGNDGVVTPVTMSVWQGGSY